jgi:hypothetical protein
MPLPSCGAAGDVGFSFPIWIPLVVDPVLLIAMVVGRAHWWGYLVQAVYLALVLLFLWIALSKSRFEKAQAKVATLQRANWVMNWMFFFVILPLLLWAFFGLRPMLHITPPAPQWRG